MDKYLNTQVGDYLIIERMPYKDKDGHALYKGKCSLCGKVFEARINTFKNAVSCSIHPHFLVGWKIKRIRNIFKAMKKRCYDKNDNAYRWYGEKGIKICQEWLENPLLFEKWALENGYEDGLTIDRLDETKDYCPENCHWIPMVDNSRYKSTTHLIEVDGIIKTRKEWSIACNFGINTINNCVRNYGEDLTKELIRCRLKNKTAIRFPKNISWAEFFGLI